MDTLTITRQHRTVFVARLLADCFDISTSEARRKLKEGAVKIWENDYDNVKWEHLTGCVADFDGKVISLGKRKFARIVANNG
jgi:tyrosyl-tRNA synthetase